MFKRVFTSITLVILFSLYGCSHQNLNWNDAMHSKIQRYDRYSYNQFSPYFSRIGVNNPPQELAFLIFKSSKRFEIYARDDGPWKFVRSYSILAASGELGPKLHAGDRQVPEGIYHIVGLNPASHFDLSMHLDYPNEFDRREASADHRRNLGGDIFIHGDKLSVGCIALGNNTIRQLFPLVYHVGINHVIVVIAPYDFREEKPTLSRCKVRTKWVNTLYSSISRELRQFPEHSHFLI